MEIVYALAIGVLAASGVWLLLRPRTFQVLMGLLLLSYATNLFIFGMGRLEQHTPPILEAGCLAEIFEGGAVKSQRFAEAYAAVAKRHGCAFLDAGAVIVSSPLDGVHFDAEEHGKLGRAVAAALTKMRKEQL